ncbi:GNAT family N-acetyltransferase [Stutzerimonas degradans]|uniref:GNAT family N-acetyltransferase n=1 Tax=Stutzerimonas degradans TaxID=2968968 RepID=A0A8E2QAD5_9GAMM|nr:GNAT family N-acetyltransferase [Stutzerimonas degradans]MCQ4276958.1 GNAT family N-acetyltransferase [Stutzerimonas degradans]PNF74919.1 GNAT family N-acetyltransferase [Stutzerimonas degradans]QPT23013.1 GNAT family N-acetyltransferase [Stutzerimonas degradans]
MFTLTHLDTPPPEALKSQLLQMVVDYLGDISPVSLTPSNPLYQLYQYVVGFEVHRYLDSMDGAQAGKPELIMALDADDPATLLGFALYLPYMDDPEACALVYLAVLAEHRRQGIGRAMVDTMVTRYPHAEVACVAGKVPYFEALGFMPLAARGPQVVLNTRNQASPGVVAVQDLAPIFQSKEVRQIHSYLMKQHGEKAMSDAEKQRDRLLDQLAEQANHLIETFTSARRLH